MIKFMKKGTNIRPLPGYVLIEPIEEELKQGEVYLPETSKDKPMKGKVVDIRVYGMVIDEKGRSLEKDKEWRYWHQFVQKGQTVIYKKWVNQEIQHEGKKYLLVKFDELLAVIE